MRSPGEISTSMFSLLGRESVVESRSISNLIISSGNRMTSIFKPGRTARLVSLSVSTLPSLPRLLNPARRIIADPDFLQSMLSVAFFLSSSIRRTKSSLRRQGMRALKQQGYMHNRLRMVTAMFLTKDLLLDWRLGEKHFMENLIDGDLGSK